MGGGASGNISKANDISQQQVNIASGASQQSAAQYAQAQQLISPLIKQQTALASGNRDEALSAAMPVISQLSGGYDAAKANIANTMPSGPAKDQALANLQVQKATGIGTAQAQAVQEASTTLAGLGTGFYGPMSMQSLGASLAGLQGGAQTNYGAGQMAAAQQQAMLNFFGGLAKDATGMVNPISFLGGGGGGSTPSSSTSSWV
jgi:hypothetical protein